METFLLEPKGLETELSQGQQQYSSVTFQNEYPGLSVSVAVPAKHLFTLSTGLYEAVSRLVARRAYDLPQELARRVSELSALPEDWDGRNAQTIKPPVLADVVEFLRRLAQRPDYRNPFLAPTFDGFVQIEWHDESRSLEIEAVSGGWFVGGTWTKNGRNPQYFEAECGRSDFDKLEAFYDWLLGNEMLLWPSS